MRTTAIFLAASLLVVPTIPSAQERAVPSPAGVFGFEPGADYRLANYDQSLAYFRKLAAASPLVKLIEAGKTSQGRPMYLALISSRANLARIARLREIALRLAHPGGMTAEEAARLAREGKAFVHVDGGLHSTEVAAGQHTPLLAYELVRRAAEPEVKAMLDNVVIMLWPSLNPDGQQMVADWYMKNVGTPYELSDVPGLYQDYVGHDNNRDAYMLNMIESRVVEHAWRQWEPQIVYVHHQTGPFPSRIWLPPFSEPVGTHAPPLMSREVNMLGMAIAKRLEENGQPGAIHMGTAFDAWYPGYIDYAPNFKNVAAFWTETALYQYATPHEYTMDDVPASMRDLRPRSLYSSPWKPGWWRLRDAVEYMKTASLAVIEYAAKYKDSLLLNRYKAAVAQVERGRNEAPYGYVIPRDQGDPVAAVELLRRLAFGGVRVFRLSGPAVIDGAAYAAGTWVVPADQEFAALAREVLDVQAYPDLRQYPNGPPERPYDAAGWTLPLQMGVQVVPVKAPFDATVRASLKPVAADPQPTLRPTPYESGTVDRAPFDSVPGLGFESSTAAAAIVPPDGTLTGEGTGLSLSAAENNAYRAVNSAWKHGATVRFLDGRFIIDGLAPAAQAELVRTLAVRAERTDATGGTPLARPRIGVFEPWGGSMDAGWTRWVLERYGFEFVTLRPEDFATPLSEKVDVVVLADDARIPLEGAPSGGGRGGPPRPVRPEYADRVSAEDLRAFDSFVRSGGTVVCLNNASNFAIQQFKLPVRNIVAGLRPEEFFLRGSIVEARVDRGSAVMAGMPEAAALFADNSPVFETLDGFTGTVLARYRESGSPLLSGYLIGDKYMNGKAAAIDVRLDAGHVILLGFRPQWRGQPFGAFKVLFNSVLSARRPTASAGHHPPAAMK